MKKLLLIGLLLVLVLSASAINLNNIQFTGSVYGEPITGVGTNGSTTLIFNVAISTGGTEDQGNPPLVIRVNAYGALAEYASNWISDGMTVTVIGQPLPPSDIIRVRASSITHY